VTRLSRHYRYVIGDSFGRRDGPFRSFFRKEAFEAVGIVSREKMRRDYYRSDDLNDSRLGR